MSSAGFLPFDIQRGGRRLPYPCELRHAPTCDPATKFSSTQDLAFFEPMECALVTQLRDSPHWLFCGLPRYVALAIGWQNRPTWPCAQRHIILYQRLCRNCINEASLDCRSSGNECFSMGQRNGSAFNRKHPSLLLRIRGLPSRAVWRLQRFVRRPCALAP
jgi:hypothetical protein